MSMDQTKILKQTIFQIIIMKWNHNPNIMECFLQTNDQLFWVFHTHTTFTIKSRDLQNSKDFVRKYHLSTRFWLRLWYISWHCLGWFIVNLYYFLYEKSIFSNFEMF